MSKRRQREVLQRGYVIEYDGGARHSFGGRPWPWRTEWAAQRFLNRNTTFQRRGGRVVPAILSVDI